MKHRTICTVSIFLLLSILLSGCGKAASNQVNDPVRFTSFRDIPGVTEDEIMAIESLQKQGGPLIYATSLMTETFMDEDGQLGGFTVLLCDWLTELFGIQFRTEIHDLSNVLAKLETGEISFGALTATEDRLENYYMTAPIIHRSIKVMRINESPSPDEIVLTRPVRYIFMEGGTIIDSVTASFAPNSYEAIVVKDHETAYQTLSGGEADAFIGINIAEGAFDPYGGVITEDFLPLIVTPVSLAAQDHALAPIISVVTKALDSGAYMRLTELYRQGYQEYKKNKFLMLLSGEERAYMLNTPVIPFATQYMSYPVSFYDKNERKWDGIVFNVINEIERLTGFTFELVNDQTMEIPGLMNLLETGTAYTIPNFIQSDERRERFIWPNTLYLPDRYALLSKRSYPNIELNDIPFAKVGYARASAFADMFHSWFPTALYTMEYPNTDDAFMALDSGEIDLMMSSQSRLTALTNYYELSDFKANYLFNVSFNASFGFNKDQTVLCSIIDKALPLIDTGRIVEQWLSRTYNIEIMRLREQRPWLFGMLALFLCVLALLAILFARSRRTGKRLENLVKERTHDFELQTAKLQAMFGSLPDIVFCKDLDLRYTQCNRVTEEQNGVSEADIIGKTDIETSIFPADVAERIMEEDRFALKEGRKVVIEETLPYYNGVTRILETVRSPLVQDDVIVGLIVIARDITKRKEIERELAMQTAILTTLFDSIPDFIFTKDVNFCYMQCNKSYLAHLGFSREDVIGKNDVDGFKLDPELVEEYWVWDRKVISEGRKFMLEERIPGADGTNPLYETVKAPLVLDGKIIGLLGIAHDITHRKEMEEAALAASRSKSVFLANMSHEIRTPMNSIIGFSELAMDSEVSPKTREYLAKIQSNAEWLLQIINDILDISKIESGKMELENIPFDMHELFESCRTLIMPKAVEKGIKLQFYAEPSVGKRPLGDPTRLRQILVNLLSNAVKFTNSGTVKVLTEIKERTEKTVAFHFEIKDSGIGMTDEQIKRIFEPFIQAESGTTRKYGGTGLGLSISKNFIELMGGRLVVESIPGVGSKFSFDLMFDTVDINGYETFEQKAVLDEIEKPVFSGEILLCEDNEMNQQVICEHLSRVGLKTVVAENGKIGVQEVQSRKKKDDKQFDLIFMDIHMPVMDGIEAAAKIIELETEVPIVAMTANIMSSDMEIYKTSGMHDCIGKPFTSQELWRCLLKYLKPVSSANAEQKNSQVKDILLGDDLEFSKGLQKTFFKNNQKKIEEITKALEDGDIKLAHRLTHTLKSNAGQIGKTALQQAAADVEYQLKDGKNLVTGKQMALFEKELSTALSELAADFAPFDEPESAQGETLDADAARKLFDKLEPMLKMGNPESRKYIDSLRQISGSETLIQQIEDFEFESALSSLHDLMKGHE